MFTWYQNTIIATGRQPLFLAVVAFVATFILTRAITRLIKSGRGPFGNVSAGGLHIHHVVPGVICLLLGGIILLSATRYGPWYEIGAVLFGMGSALVLDEFAMILHLDDVYWKKEGFLSVDAISIALAVMAAALLVSAPDNPPGPPETDPHAKVIGPLFFFIFWLLPLAITVLKGKLFTAVFGVIWPVFVWVGALRLAKPGSPWAVRRYASRPEKFERAKQRSAKLDRLVLPLRRWWGSTFFGFSPDAAVTKAVAEAAEARAVAQAAEERAAAAVAVAVEARAVAEAAEAQASEARATDTQSGPEAPLGASAQSGVNAPVADVAAVSPVKGSK